MKKNGFTMVELIAIVVIMASMLLIILPAINNTIKNSEEKKKQESLNNIYMAAENYLMANYDDYKLNNPGDNDYVYITDLISNNYMSIDTLNPNNDSTFSNKDAVKVTRNEDGTFSYELVYLKTLIETLLEQYSSDNTTGLLRDSVNENIYYYKGTNEEVANNFLWYGGHQWRVIEFDTSANTLTLITQQPLTSLDASNKVWTTEKEYNESYINSWLNDYFWNSLDSSIQSNILDSTFNIGIYSDVDKITTTKKVGLLDVEQYERTNGVNSYLDIKNMWWLGNHYDETFIRFVDMTGMISNYNVLYSVGVRAVIKIKDINIVDGNGTLSYNYKTIYKSLGANDVQVGEYIDVPTTSNECGEEKLCTFRVVNKDNDSIKLVLNGLLATTSIYGNSNEISTEHEVYNLLKKFLITISDEYIYTGNKKFYTGKYPNGSNYIDIKSQYLVSSFGLPSVGEMFSGNDLNLGTSGAKIFVDQNTIENSYVSTLYWILNSFTDLYAPTVYQNGILNNHPINSQAGIRPVIYLKNNLTFTGGDGTAQNPYTLD